VAEFVPGYEASSVYGLGAPKNTPTEVVDKLNREINTAFADTKIKARFSELGSVVLPGSASRKCRPAQFRKPRLHFGVGDTATPAFDRGRSNLRRIKLSLRTVLPT